jgi:hypothetical protein
MELNQSGLLNPTLRGNTQMPPGGCKGSENPNINRAGVEHMSGGAHVAHVDTKSQLLGRGAGYMGHEAGKNCGTVNPNNHGASSQSGGGCGCSGQTAAYGFVGGDSLGELRGSYAPVKEVSTCATSGGARRRHKSRKHGRKHKKSNSKTRKHGRKHKKGGSKHRRSTRHNKRVSRHHRRASKSSHRRRSKGTRKHHRRMHGGYAQYGTNVPFSTGYNGPRSVTPSNSALANPMPRNRVMIAGDNYNHFKGTHKASPTLDKDVQ